MPTSADINYNDYSRHPMLQIFLEMQIKIFFVIALALSISFASSTFAVNCTASGNTTYCDDGTSYTRSGNTIYNSDGISCTRSGNTMYCN